MGKTTALYDNNDVDVFDEDFGDNRYYADAIKAGKFICDHCYCAYEYPSFGGYCRRCASDLGLPTDASLPR